jgi:glycerophosphoryl diester phosphodiesterase
MSYFNLDYVLLVLAAYALYCVCWYYPFFHRKKRHIGTHRSKAESIAHRGSRDEGLPENTVAAFKDSVNAQTDIVELDVWLTTDGKVVVHHDDTLTRMTCGASSMKIAEMKHADIPPITLTKAQAKRTDAFKKKECLSIPLFEEALAAVPSPTCLIIEFKQDSDRLISEVVRILHEQGRKDDVFWFSLDEKINKKLRVADSAIPTITSIPGMLKVLALYYTGLLPFVEIDDAVFGITVEAVRKSCAIICICATVTVACAVNFPHTSCLFSALVPTL